MKKPARQAAMSPKEQHATFLAEVEKLRADGVLTSTDGEALEALDGLMQKKALTNRPEPSLDTESLKGDN